MESFYNLILITRIPNGGKSILLYTVYNETTIQVFNSDFIVHRFCNTSIEKKTYLKIVMMCFKSKSGGLFGVLSMCVD